MFFARGAGRAGGAQVARRGGTPVWMAGILAVLLLLAAGIAYRVMAAGVETVVSTPLKLPVPLSAIPKQLDGWTGQDANLSPSIVDYMRANFADDYMNRHYENAAQRFSVGIYVVYCASHPSGIVGHKPRVCYPGNGWIWDETVSSRIISRGGRPIDCLVHQFHKPAPAYQQVYVLNFYVLNGQITLRESDFSGFFDRLPNLAGNPARYVAQVQISALMEQAARVAASDFADTILALLPDEQGRVQAAHLTDTSGPAPDATGTRR